MNENMNSENPYQAPIQAAPVPTDSPSRLNRMAEKKFQQQIIALGGFWICTGLVAIAVALALPIPKGNLANGMWILILGGMGVLWTVIGTLTCMKMIPAVWVGLVLSYLSLIASLMGTNLCGIVILVPVIGQSHRVLSWSKRR